MKGIVGENKPNITTGPVRIWAVSPATENQIETNTVVRIGFTKSVDYAKVDGSWLQLRIFIEGKSERREAAVVTQHITSNNLERCIEFCRGWAPSTRDD